MPNVTCNETKTRVIAIKQILNEKACMKIYRDVKLNYFVLCFHERVHDVLHWDEKDDVLNTTIDNTAEYINTY